MSEPVKIASLELENIKRIKAVSITPTSDGLTIIGGRNAQGKTSVLDAIAWALGGNAFKPTNPNREGSATPAKLKIELSNGLIVTRQGTSGALKVIDPTGKKSGQTLLNSFIEQLALNLPKFMNSNDKEKAEVLLDLIGLRDQIQALDTQIAQLSDQRRPLKTDYLGKRKIAADMPFYADAPDTPISASELIEQQQKILARNGHNQELRQQVNIIKAKTDAKTQEIQIAHERISQLKQTLAEQNSALEKLNDEKVRLLADLNTAQKTAETLQDESTAEIEAKLCDIDAVNQKVHANQRRADMEADAELAEESYKNISQQIDEVRKKRITLLNGVHMPLEGLDVKDGYLVYKGATWSSMSSAEQLQVATAIIRELNPECGFVLIDKLEQMDTQTLAEFGAWAQSVGLQAIGTRVSTGNECSVIIEDGYADDKNTVAPADLPITQDAAEPVIQPLVAPASTHNKQAVFTPGVF